MLCPNGHESPVGSHFCIDCGTALVTEADSEVTCPNGHTNPDTAKFCVECGSPLAKGASSLGQTAKRGKRMWLAVVIVVVASLAAGGVTAWLVTRGDTGDDADRASTSASTSSSSVPTEPAEPETMTVAGIINNQTGDYYYIGNGPRCKSEGDVSKGAQVTVYDASGAVIGIGTLGNGVERNLGSGYGCVFPFTIDDVPAEGSIFSIEVSFRGRVNFTKDEASSLALSIGG